MAIVAAVDGGKNSGNVVETGHDLATAYGETLYVVHVITESDFESKHENSPEYYRDDARHEASRVAERVVEESVGEAENVKAVGRVGNVADQVIDFAEGNDARFIVTGGRRRSPTGKAVFGSDTQKILLNAPVPVVAVMGQEGDSD